MSTSSKITGRGANKTENIKETIIYNDIGEEIHILKGIHGSMSVKKIEYDYNHFTGEEWCPYCHTKIEHLEGYWECPICNYSITDDEVEYGDGYPSLEATYEDDYGEYYDE